MRTWAVVERLWGVFVSQSSAQLFCKPPGSNHLLDPSNVSAIQGWHCSLCAFQTYEEQRLAGGLADDGEEATTTSHRERRVTHGVCVRAVRIHFAVVRKGPRSIDGRPRPTDSRRRVSD